MAEPIKLFQFTQKFYKLTGIRPPQPNQLQSSINLTNKIYLICLAQVNFSTIAFIVFEAHSMLWYGYGFFLVINFTTFIIVYTIYMMKAASLFKFFEECEEFIEKSEYHSKMVNVSKCHNSRTSVAVLSIGVHSRAAYKKFSERLELLTTVLTYANLCAVSSCMFPPLPYTLTRYYILDLGEKSYYLLYPSWFVSLSPNIH